MFMSDRKNENFVMRIFYHSEVLTGTSVENPVNYHDTYEKHILHISRVNLE